MLSARCGSRSIGARSALLGPLGLGAPRVGRLVGSSRLSLRPRAQGDGGDGGTDWDGAWTSFQRQLRSQVEVKNTTSGRRVATDGARPEPVRRPAPRRVLGSNNSGGWGGQEGERIRRAERVLVDIWSSEDFARGGVLFSIVLLFIFALVVGPPPSDGRCSLFWC